MAASWLNDFERLGLSFGARRFLAIHLSFLMIGHFMTFGMKDPARNRHSFSLAALACFVVLQQHFYAYRGWLC